MSAKFPRGGGGGANPFSAIRLLVLTWLKIGDLDVKHQNKLTYISPVNIFFISVSVFVCFNLTYKSNK